MRKHRRFTLAAVFAVAAVVTTTSRADLVTRSVPRAVCGPEDRVEIVQGQTTLAERFKPGKSHAYTCNLELAGQFQGEGAGFDLEVLGNCAYYATALNSKMHHPGTAVLDVSDSTQPRVTVYLDSPAMLNAVESLSVDPVRKLLLASKPVGTAAEPFEIYDLSADCKHPRLVRSVVLPRMMSHVGEFGPDGRLFYATSWDIPPQKKLPVDPTLPPSSAVFVIDVSDPSVPKGIATWIPEQQWKTHSVSLSKDGTRAYVAISWRPWSTVEPREPHGLALLDISDFQARRPNPRFRVLSTLFWEDTREAQFIVPMMVAGTPYLVFTDLTGAVGYVHPAPEGVCQSGRPGYGFPRIIDISDEKQPRIVAKLMLEVADPGNCSSTSRDPTGLFGYGSVACDVDSRENASLLACGYFEGGLRVFDIRRPDQPKEIAYYKPPARRKDVLPGSTTRAWGMDDLTADPVIVARFRKNREIWMISSDNAFQVLRFSNRFKSANKDLFSDETPFASERTSESVVR